MRVINGLLRFLAFFLLAAVVFALPLSLLARDMGQLVFDAATIKSLVSDNLLSPEFVGELAQRATRGILENSEGAEKAMSEVPAPDEAAPEEEEGLDMALIGEGLSYLKEDDWVQIASLIAPSDVVSETVDTLVDGYIAWLDGDTDFPEIVLNLSEWKANTQAHAVEVVEIVLAALPECTAEEIAAQALEGIQEGESLAQVAIPVCQPTGATATLLLDNADYMVSGLTEHAPDELDTALLQGESAPEELVRLKAALVRARIYLRWGWVAVFGALLLGVLMASRSWPQALVWAGWPLLLAGGLTLAFGFGAQVLAAGGLARLVETFFQGAPVTLSAIGSTVAEGVFPLVARPLLVQGGFMLALGLGGLIGGRVLRGRQDMPALEVEANE